MSDAQSLTGRVSRCLLVYDLNAKNVALLKDNCCADLRHLGKDLSIPKELINLKVHNVSHYICGDELGQSTHTQESARKGKVWKLGQRLRHLGVDSTLGLVALTNKLFGSTDSEFLFYHIHTYE